MKQPARAPQDKKPAAKTQRKTRDESNAEARDRKRDKKHRGNASGSRANPVTVNKKSGESAVSKDPRIGSKKPIALGPVTADAQPAKKVAKVAKPVEEKKSFCRRKKSWRSWRMTNVWTPCWIAWKKARRCQQKIRPGWTRRLTVSTC